MTTTTHAEHVSPMESNVDRLYWSAMLPNRMMPGLGLAAARYGWRLQRHHAAVPATGELPKRSGETAELSPRHS